MKAVLFAAGRMSPASAWLHEACRDAELLVAVDGGLRHVLAAGLAPHLLVGDLDSVDEESLLRANVPEIMRFEADKSETDLELAIHEVVGRGAGQIVIAGALGARHDHTLANLLLAARLKQELGLRISLAGDGTLAWPLSTGDQLILPVPAGTLFSLLAVQQDCRVSIRGARYELAGATLPFGRGLGVSNETVKETLVSVDAGLLLVMAAGDV